MAADGGGGGKVAGACWEGLDVAAGTGKRSLAEGRGSGNCVAGRVWLKACSTSVVVVVRPHELAGRLRQGGGLEIGWNKMWQCCGCGYKFRPG